MIKGQAKSLGPEEQNFELLILIPSTRYGYTSGLKMTRFRSNQSQQVMRLRENFRQPVWGTASRLFALCYQAKGLMTVDGAEYGHSPWHPPIKIPDIS